MKEKKTNNTSQKILLNMDCIERYAPWITSIESHVYILKMLGMSDKDIRKVLQGQTVFMVGSITHPYNRTTYHISCASVIHRIQDDGSSRIEIDGKPFETFFQQLNDKDKVLMNNVIPDVATKTLTDIISQKSVVQLVLNCFGRDLPLHECSNSNMQILTAFMLKHISRNSAKTYMAYIKSALNKIKATENVPHDFADSLNLKSEETISVYLTEDELKRLYWYAETPAERFYISHFLISAFEGCRCSDIKNIKECNITDGILEYQCGKTGYTIKVPARTELNEWLREISSINIDFCDRTYLHIIKRICERAEIKDTVNIHRAGMDKENHKYNFISGLTAQRSFVTNLYLRGVDLYTIGRYMGHSSPSQTARYLCGNNLNLSEKLKNFF